MTQVYIWKNGSAEEWEQISLTTFSKLRKSGALSGRYFTEMGRDIGAEHDHIILECTQEQYTDAQKEWKHQEYLQREERRFALQCVSMDDDAAFKLIDVEQDIEEVAIKSALLNHLKETLEQLSEKERKFIFDYYELCNQNSVKLGSLHGISQQAAHKRLKKLLEKIKKVVVNSTSF